MHAQTVLELAMGFWSMLAMTSGPLGARKGDNMAQGRKGGKKERKRSEGKQELHL